MAETTAPSFAVVYVETVADLPDWLPSKLRAEHEEMLASGDRYDRGTLLIIKTGDRTDVECDGGEPEDNLFFRGWSWVAPAIQRAYEQGLKDGAAGKA